jgi:hypothetical protein
MNDATYAIRLDGLEPDNLLAFLVLLGCLRTLELARPDWHARAAWDLDNPPLRPLLFLEATNDPEQICQVAAEGAALLADDYTFPTDSDQLGEAQVDLNYDKAIARRLLEHVVAGGGRRRADLWSALMCDAAEKDDRIEATPLCLLFGQGHQHFLDRLATVPRTETLPPRGRGKKAVTPSAAQVLHEALFEPWARPDPTPSFRWDPAEDVRYALRADDPSSEKSRTQHGANRLAALGLPLLTVTPAQRGERVRLQMVGGAFERGEFIFRWPIWREPASLAGIRALLSHPKLASDPLLLAHLSVVEVRRTRRIGVGKFMNFTRAVAIAATG